MDSSILAWEMPQIEALGQLQSTGLQRDDWVTHTFTFRFSFIEMEYYTCQATFSCSLKNTAGL